MTPEQFSALTAWIEAYLTEAEAFTALVAGDSIVCDDRLRAMLNPIADALEAQVRVLRFATGAFVPVH
jgi:hypothetical protein